MRRNQTPKFLILFLISPLYNSSSSPTKISTCLCSESSSNCFSSPTPPFSLLFSADFNTVSPVDKYSLAWVSEENVTNSFGRKNKGKSLLFSPSSSVKINSLNSFQGEGISLSIWIRMSGAYPYTFSSILSIASLTSPFSENDSASK